MKTSLKSLLVIALGGIALVAQAQPAPKIVVLDTVKIFEAHHRTAEHQNKMRGDQQKAQEELERLVKELNGLAEDFKSTREQSENSALTTEARQKATEDGMKKRQEIASKEQEINQFRGAITQSMQNRARQFNETLFDEISKVATDIGRKKGANMILDKSAPTVHGFNRVIYVDNGFDITEEVIAEIAKTRPVGAPTPAATPPAPVAAPKSGSTTEAPITFPGAKK